MGTECCCKCGRYFDSRDDAGDTIYPGYKGDSWACYACHEQDDELTDLGEAMAAKAEDAL